jgi:hypothetical protein
MATVSEILNEFCDRINQPREASYIGASTPAARQYVSLLKFITSSLLDQGDWACLKRTYTFTTVLNQSLYQLPGDYWKPLSQTQYSVTNQIPMGGPLTDSNLAFRSYGVAPTGIFPSYQINGAQNYIFNTAPYTQRSAGYFQISPTGVNGTDQNVIGYISRNCYWPQAWVATTGYSLGDIRTGVANMYRVTTAGTSGTTRPSVTSGTVVDGTVTWTVYTEPYPLTADTDFSLLEDDLMVEGMRWAWYQSKKQTYGDIRKDWESSCRVALGRNNAGAVISAGYDVNGPDSWPNVPLSNWAGTGDV